MPSDFKDKVVLITGAGSGIGRATTLKLATLNATLALCDIDYEALESTKKACIQASPVDDAQKRIHIEDVDTSDVKEVNTLVMNVLGKFKRINHVFNCAGINPTAIPIEDTSDEYWERMLSVNLKGVFNVTRKVVPYLEEGSTFVNVSSVLGLHPSAQNSVYCATKYGLIGFSKSMALELGPRGIRTNVVAPGNIDTPTNAANVKGGQAVEQIKKGNAMGRMGTPEEVADVVVFLLGEESRYMNGAVVEIDGGVKRMGT